MRQIACKVTDAEWEALLEEALERNARERTTRWSPHLIAREVIRAHYGTASEDGEE